MTVVLTCALPISPRLRQLRLGRAGWIGDYNDPQNFLYLNQTGVSFNYPGWSNADYDEKMAAAAETTDLEARAHMMSAAAMGAVAFQKGLGVVHSLAHPLSTLLDTHHGLANAVTIPYGMEFNIKGFEGKFRQLARSLSLTSETGQAVVDYLFELNSRIGIPHKLSEIGVKHEHIEPLADLAFGVLARQGIADQETLHVIGQVVRL